MNNLLDRIPLFLEIYEEGNIGIINLNEIKNYLQEKTAIQVFLRGNIYENLSIEQTEIIAQKIAGIRIKDPQKKFLSQTPLDGEVHYEKEKIKVPRWRSWGILYEGILYQALLRDLILKSKLDERYCSILITNQLLGTWEQYDQRYHIRTSLYGFPNIISVPGLVLAPAKPREFYFMRQLGLPENMLKEDFRGRFLDHGDPRTTEVIKGYIMQALFYYLIENPFCEDRDCRLFNSHWQEEMLHAQLNGRYEFCPEHEAILKRIKKRKRNAQSSQGA